MAPKHSTVDLRSFLDQAGKQVLCIDKVVDPATQVAALCSETTRPLLLDNLQGYPGFRLADCLTRCRDTQALALGIEGDPAAVIPGYVEKLARGPGPTVAIDNAPVREVIWTGDETRLRYRANKRHVESRFPR